MKMLFVSHSNRKKNLYLDPSVRYRCYNFTEELTKAGQKADVCHFTGFKSDFIDRYDAFVFHKPKISGKLKKIVKRIESAKKPAAADFDDLVFDERYAGESSLYLSGRASLKYVSKAHRSYHRALALFKKVTVSTEPLKAFVRGVNPNADIKVIFNGLSKGWVIKGQVISKQVNNKKYIGYFPGTSTHQFDLKVVEKPLIHFLRDHPGTGLLVLGPLEIDEDKFNGIEVKRHPAVAYEELPYWIRKCWVTIAPLADTCFNRCKSGLKFFESASWGVPLVATEIPDFKRFGCNVLFADKKTSWEDHFEHLKDASFYDKFSSKIRRYTEKHCMVSDQVPRLLDFIRPGEGRMWLEKSAGRSYDDMFVPQVQPDESRNGARQRLSRKFRKFRRDPYSFFNDSKIAPLRALRCFYEKPEFHHRHT